MLEAAMVEKRMRISSLLKLEPRPICQDPATQKVNLGHQISIQRDYFCDLSQAQFPDLLFHESIEISSLISHISSS
jgi:hypothetical protein